MKAAIEFVGYFLSKTGRSILEMDFKEEEATVRQLIIGAENAMIDRNFKVIEDGKLKNGVLLFRRKNNGGMDRIFELDSPLNESGDYITMANLMGGG